MVMRRNTAWRKNNWREVRHTWERYIAILAIIALGVAFYSGLKVTQPAMIETLDGYVKKYNMHDYRLMSTLGLTGDDVQYFAELDGFTAEGAITFDFIADVGREEQVVLKAYSITDSIGTLNLKHGRLPEAPEEAILDNNFFSEDIIGSKVRVSLDNDKDTIDAFNSAEFTVVGLVDSVNYINYDRGTTTLANGTIAGFIYLPENAFTADYYTEIVLSLGSNHRVYSQEYKDLISAHEEKLETELKNRAELRYQEIVREAEEELTEAEDELATARNEYLAEKADAEEELASALIELEDAERTIAESEEKLRDGEKAIVRAEREYRRAVSDYEASLKQFENEKTAVLASLEAQQTELAENMSAVTYAMTLIEESEDPVDVQQYEVLKGTLAQLEAGQQQLDAGKAEAEAGFAAAETQLADGKAQLDAAKNEIDKNKREIAKGWTELEDGKAEYLEGLQEYEDGRREADEAFAEAEDELAEADAEIADARKEIADIPKPKVFVLNRNHNMGYVNYENDSSIVAGIATVLPLFFFLVAALVTSVTMTRMVDEQRTQIGTLKALGYTDGAITRKFMFYAGSAAVIGCLAGFLLGTKFFPMAIYKAYGMIYQFAPIEYIFDPWLALTSLAASLICSAGVTYVSCKTEMLQMPAQLIRPKAPKGGKRVLLERIPVLWKRISFLHKVSIRNILLYKKRFFMTVIGIAGCTALIVAALGINDSIGNVANDQFDDIMTYDYDISFADPRSNEQREGFIELYSDLLSEVVFASSSEVEVMHGEQLKKVTSVATDDTHITELMILQLNNNPVPFPVNGEVVVNNRLAQELDIDAGDIISVKISETEKSDVMIGGVFDNYVGDYILMTAQTYKVLHGNEPEYKSAFAEASGGDIHSIAAKLLNDDTVVSVSILDDVRAMVGNMMQSLNYIIWLVIAFAGALGFVVIYNLNNINITERSREIASLKVLGFFPKESQTYIFRETLTLTAMGTLVGLVMGKLLHMFIMNEIKVDMISFKEQIFPISYIIAFAATFLIAILVNLMIAKKIEKINMTESLKSVE